MRRVSVKESSLKEIEIVRGDLVVLKKGGSVGIVTDISQGAHSVIFISDNQGDHGKVGVFYDFELKRFYGSITISQ